MAEIIPQDAQVTHARQTMNTAYFDILGHIIDHQAGELIPPAIRNGLFTPHKHGVPNIPQHAKQDIVHASEPDRESVRLIADTAIDLARRDLYREAGQNHISWDIARCAIIRVSHETQTHTETPPSRLKDILRSYTSTQLGIHRASIPRADQNREAKRRTIEECYADVVREVTLLLVDHGINETYYGNTQYPLLLKGLILHVIEKEFFCILFEANTPLLGELGEIAQDVGLTRNDLQDLLEYIRIAIERYKT